MEKIGLFQRISSGIRNYPRFLLGLILAVYAVGWSIIEPIISMVPSIATYLTGWSRFGFLLGVSVLVGLYKVSQPTNIRINLQGNLIEVMFGDLFNQNGLKIIPVSKYIYEVDVVPSSLQAAVITKFVNSFEGRQGHDRYFEMLDSGLAEKPYSIHTRIQQRGGEKKFTLGTTATLKHEGNDFLYFSLTETEIKGQIPPDNCTATHLWIALEIMWKSARHEARGKDIIVPLLGSGTSGVNLELDRLLELNLLSINNAILSDGKITTGKIKFILHPKHFEQIDLRNYSKVWN